MKLYFVRDERGRINRMFATTEKPDEVVYSDTFSYLYAREQFEVIGVEMALGKLEELSVK